MKRIYKYLFIAVLCSGLSANSMRAQIGLNFDGNDDKVDCGNDTSVQITGRAITLEAWIYPTVWKTNAYDGNVICKEDNNGNNGYMLRVGAGGKLNFALGEGSKSWSEITTSTLLSLNQWQHIAGTYDGTMMRVFINGKAVDSLKYSGSIGNAAATTLLVGAHTTYTRFYQGIIDEVRIWNIWKSEADLNASMNDEFCSIPKGLRLYYKFNQGKPGGSNATAKKVNDLSAHGNTGALQNFALSGSASNWVTGVYLNKSISYGKDSVTACNYYYSPTGRYKWTKTGIYHDTLLTAMECDSAVTYDITIKKSSSTTIKVSTCSSYTSPSGNYTWTKAGTYTDYLVNSVKCDSVITIILSVGGSRDTSSVTMCNAYTSPHSGLTWTSSGMYSDTLHDRYGCDSIKVTDLTINKPTGIVLNESACRFYISPLGNIYKTAGTYYDSTTNYLGCDSIITINLKMKHTFGTINPVSCGAYKSPNGKKIWTVSGIYKDTILNKVGCDSFMTINLTVTQPTFGAESVKACRYYVSPGRHRMWTKTGVYKDTLMNYLGCDSIVDVSLVVVNIDKNISKSGTTLTADAVGATSYQWLDCGNSFSVINGATSKSYTYTVDGSYAAEIKDQGCTDTSNCVIVKDAGVRNTTLSDLVKIVPNPNDGNFDLVNISEKGIQSVRIYDASGRIVYNNTSPMGNKLSITIDKISGVYRLEVITETGTYTGSVLIK